MVCAWNELLRILPQQLRRDVDMLGKKSAQQIRMRLDRPVAICLSDKTLYLHQKADAAALQFVVNMASRYSPWIADSSAQGYITAPGGHRVGLCGEAILKDGSMSGFRTLRSVSIRIARDFPGIAARLADFHGNVLIVGPPGSGKTTLLRDLIRQCSAEENIAVVDERGELFPHGFETGINTDVLSGCSKVCGIEMILRTMGSDAIAVDEITAQRDCDALIRAAFCGVRLMATAHAAGVEGLKRRAVYETLLSSGIFSEAVVLHPNKSFSIERVAL